MINKTIKIIIYSNTFKSRISITTTLVTYTNTKRNQDLKTRTSTDLSILAFMNFRFLDSSTQLLSTTTSLSSTESIDHPVEQKVPSKLSSNQDVTFFYSTARSATQTTVE